jgi:flagellar hook-associated protein 1 FlgK
MKLTVNADGSPLNPTGGKIGQLMTSRETDVNAAIANLTQFAGQLIYTMNQVHSGGQGTKGFGTLTSDNAVNDPTAALNNPVAGLTFPPTNGTFKLVLKQKSTGQSTTTQINVDLDGIGTDDSLNSLAAKLNTAGITATVTGAGKLKLDAPNSDYEFSFSDDSSGVLASLGLNSFFTGSGSGDIAVNSTLLTDPSYVAATQNSVAGGNANALSIAGLLDKSVSGLGGVSLRDFWARHVEDYATRGAQAKSDVSTTGAIADGLKSQKQAVSGVNMDEEAINLLQFQQAYTGSARFISVVNQMMDTLMNMVQ